MEAEEKLTGAIFYRRDFSRRKFHGCNLSGSVFDQCSFDDADLSEANVSGSDFRGSSFLRTNCFRLNAANAVFPATKFEPSDCYGMTVTMTCKTFENAHLSRLWFYLFLMFAASTRPVQDNPELPDLRDMLIAFIGNSRYLRLRDLLSRRNY